jgi:hypothetical protein
MPKRGESATPAQRSALAAGQAKKKAALAKSSEHDETAKQRWSRLLDGTLTVDELTDEEVERGRVHGKGKMFHGNAPRMPSNLIAAFHQEQIKRAKSILTKDLQKAAAALGKIINDPEASNNDIIKAAVVLLDRGLGKTPETVNIKAVDPWADLLAAGTSVGDMRDLSALADEAVDPVDNA